MLAFAGSFSVDASPWNAIALPGGLGIAVLWRWGRGALLGASTGLLLALIGLSLPWGLALLAAVVSTTSALLAQLALRRLGFDARLERAADVGALTIATLGAAALPAALALGVWVAAASGVDPTVAFVGGWSALSLGMLATAVAVLASDRSALLASQTGAPWRASITAAAAVIFMLWLLWMAPLWRSPAAEAALFLPLVVTVVLALRGQLAWAAGGLLAAALLAGGNASHGLPLWATASNPAPSLAAWLASGLALMLSTHAATVDWRARAQRWEWALDGSHLGVADWHLHLADSFASAAWRNLTGHAEKAWHPADWQAQVHVDDRAELAAAIASLSSGDSGRRRIELRLPHGAGRRPDRRPLPLRLADADIASRPELETRSEWAPTGSDAAALPPVSPQASQPAAQQGAPVSAWRWAEATLMVIERDHIGQPVRLLATLADVDDRHAAQEQQLMSVSLFQHLHEGLLITDAALRALDVNSAYMQILGVSRSEVLGTVPSLLRPSPSDPLARQQRAAMWASLRDSGSWRGELREQRQNGEPCTLQATISTVRGAAHDLRYHVLVISDITEQRAQREQLERQAHFDELTRLPNRARLSQLLDEAMLATDRDGYLLVVCYLDLDRFKPVNDRYGHAAGDRLLAELAGRLRSALRSRGHWADSAARLGGDEFVMLLRAGTLEEARLAVERVLRVVSRPYVIDPDQDPVHITASMGATVYPVDKSDADTLLRHADNAMYGAKQSGRNGYLFFDPEHRRRTEQRVMAIGRIQEALDQQEFLLYYQPKVDMQSGRVLGFEALLRWEHPEHGMVAPMQFLPLIENTGLSSQIGDWVLTQALEHLSSWHREGFDFSVSVNVSARHLQEPDFAQRLSELLARHAEPLASRLELEMLETAAHADIDATSALLARCKAIGVRIALDDFGTGYSTLTYLKRLPVDVLKIDRSFVHHMLDDAQDRAIVEGVIGLARTFGCTVVAEGVESPAQARTLLNLGCVIGQGTGIAAPMPSTQVAGWVREYRGMFEGLPAQAA